MVLTAEYVSYVSLRAVPRPRAATATNSAMHVVVGHSMTKSATPVVFAMDIHSDLKAPMEAADISMANDGTGRKAVGLCLEDTLFADQDTSLGNI